jgi:photosystem II stability/assembly factor-like uncharacterized protein
LQIYFFQPKSCSKKYKNSHPLATRFFIPYFGSMIPPIRHYLSFILLLLVACTETQAQKIELLQQGKPTSIRGLSVVDDSTAWISGSKGYIAITTNGGKTWVWQQVKGFEQADFRDIEAFSAKEAVIMSSGTPALVLKTIDGGQTWQLKYKNTDTAYFLDAMDFADTQHGYILGDPINNKFLLLETKDGGNTWDPFKDQPTALTNEAAFAASGTCVRVEDQNIFIVSGGPAARLFDYDEKTKHWNISRLPITKGASAKGAFSLAKNNKSLVVVGGDYSHDKLVDSVACYSRNSGKSWQLATNSQAGFQSCVEYIKDKTFFSTGTPGTNMTTDGGRTWTKIDAASYNVCRKAKHGALVLLAGGNGKIAILKP